MNFWMKAALLFVSAGYLASAICLMNSTPLTMTVFFFLGVPCFMGGLICYFVNLFVIIRGVSRSDGPSLEEK